MNIYSRNDISRKRHTIPALTILQPVWGTLNPHCTQQIIQDQGGDSRIPADFDPKGRQTHRGKVNDIARDFSNIRYGRLQQDIVFFCLSDDSNRDICVQIHS